jgi:hypothetical protein
LLADRLRNQTVSHIPREPAAATAARSNASEVTASHSVLPAMR